MYIYVCKTDMYLYAITMLLPYLYSVVTSRSLHVTSGSHFNAQALPNSHRRLTTPWRPLSSLFWRRKTTSERHYRVTTNSSPPIHDIFVHHHPTILKKMNKTKKWENKTEYTKSIGSPAAQRRRPQCGRHEWRFSVRVLHIKCCVFAYTMQPGKGTPGCIEKGRLIHLLGSRRGSDDGTHGTPKQAHTKCRYVYIFTYIRAAVKTPCS